MTVVVSTENKAPSVRVEAELVGDPMSDSTVKENFWPSSQWLLMVQMV